MRPRDAAPGRVIPPAGDTNPTPPPPVTVSNAPVVAAPATDPVAPRLPSFVAMASAIERDQAFLARRSADMPDLVRPVDERFPGATIRLIEAGRWTLDNATLLPLRLSPGTGALEAGIALLHSLSSSRMGNAPELLDMAATGYVSILHDIARGTPSETMRPLAVFIAPLVNRIERVEADLIQRFQRLSDAHAGQLRHDAQDLVTRLLHWLSHAPGTPDERMASFGAWAVAQTRTPDCPAALRNAVIASGHPGDTRCVGAAIVSRLGLHLHQDAAATHYAMALALCHGINHEHTAYTRDALSWLLGESINPSA